MVINDIEQTLQAITGSKNPEIYHYQHGSHPGIKWYIKTIIPGTGILNDDTYTLWTMWRHLSEHFSHLVKIVDIAYDWDGSLINQWWTIWLDQRIDVRVSWTRELGFNWKLVDYEDGLKLSAIEISSIVNNMCNNRLTEQELLKYKQLSYILEFLKTYTTDKRSKENRKTLKVIENDQIFNETTDVGKLDIK